jgi:hypothetical protein
MASWIDGYDPNQIAQKIEDGRVLQNETGKVEFKGFEHIEYTILLYSMLKFSDGIPQIEARRIVNQAVFKAGEKGVITKQSLLTEINKLEVGYLNLPYKRFVLASSLSFKTLHSLRRIRIN